MANLQAFEDYFRRADLDKDGKISGAEAVGFFQGANLPQPVLAKIWQFADQGSTGFLSKLEFYNALKLVTVAQTGRELTPEIVRAALAGPAAVQIPAPRIVTPGAPPQPAAPQVGPGAGVAPGRSTSGPAPGPGGFGDPFAASAPGAPASRWQSQPTALPSQLPSQAVPPRPGSASGQRPAGAPPQDTWPSIRSSASASSLQNYAQQHAPAQAPPASSAQSMQSFLNGPNAPPPPTQPGKDPFGSLASGSDLFSSLSSTPNPRSASTGAVSSLADAFGNDPFAASNNKSLVPVTPPSAAQKPASANSGDAFQGLGDFGGNGFKAEPASTMALVPTSVSAPSSNEPQTGTGNQLTRSLGPAPSTGLGPGFSANPPVGPGAGGAVWPRMTPVDVQRYAKVFSDVDTDKDGKITGGQARDLFLSWGLPREVLKQVWDLSDQDGDSALSGREFCTALYLMERFREGRQLPPILPPGIHLDEAPQQSSVAAARIEQARSSVAHHTAGFNVPSWQQNPGMLQPAGPGPAGMPRGPITTGMERSLPQQGQGPGPGPAASMPDISQPGVYKSKGPVLEPHLLAQLSRDEQDTLKSRHKDAEEAAKKAHDIDKQIMDYKEKAEYYRTKMQEIILFKSRCDNRLAEIQERVAADKREMEALSKRYDERFKAGGEVHSRLVAEEAAFRDIQEKKIELYNAIAKIEQGGDANGLLQSKADKIHHDLDELKKALNERSRRLGLEAKASAPTAQSFGWQPGVQDNTSDWDEDWDKFDDEGFVSVQDFMDDATGGDFASPPPLPKRAVEKVESTPSIESTPKIEASPFSDGFDFSSEPDSKVEAPKEVSSTPPFVASGPASPRAESETGRSGIESPTRDLSTSGSLAIEKSVFDTSEKTNKASQRYDNVVDSDDFGGDAFDDPPAFSSKTTSFDQDAPSFNSGSDAFGGGGVSWSTAFNHDDEADSGVRASWGIQSSAPSTQASLDGPANRTSLFGKSESSGFENSFDFGSSHVSSPGRVTDEPSSPASHRGNGDFRNSEEYDTFAPMGGATFDRSASLFGGKDTSMGSSYFDSPAHPKAGNAFARFDSFSSSAFGGGGEDRPDNSTTAGNSYFDSPVHSKAAKDSPFARFDSFSSVKGTDTIHGKGGAFSSFDDGEDAFTTSAFGAGGDSKKWSAF